ncbi:hypothetical protein Awo_c04490 [Acetobacterium woodii DSM 1030]|uniref:Uncharacterized protein n=1 Tax=Acetobacterium woodii (strain ATCC 29683 / DSM 1030 / JCM 2381 / KCTC 1655 / WB1) TaxID=931626 RepID=H6LHS1_ACEWD|nr:hypothetical protein Awo_c04490 [Acetobacterium woodii DSM 1030]
MASLFYVFGCIFAILTFIKMTSISIFQTHPSLPYFDKVSIQKILALQFYLIIYFIHNLRRKLAIISRF